MLQDPLNATQTLSTSLNPASGLVTPLIASPPKGAASKEQDKLESKLADALKRLKQTEAALKQDEQVFAKKAAEIERLSEENMHLHLSMAAHNVSEEFLPLVILVTCNGQRVRV